MEEKGQMLKVTIELLTPSDDGKAQFVEVVGTALIANDETGNDSVSNYDVLLSRPREQLTGFTDEDRKRKIWRSGRVEGFRRKRCNTWDLLLISLHNIIGPRNRRFLKNNGVIY